MFNCNKSCGLGCYSCDSLFVLLLFHVCHHSVTLFVKDPLHEGLTNMKIRSVQISGKIYKSTEWLAYHFIKIPQVNSHKMHQTFSLLFLI